MAMRAKSRRTAIEWARANLFSSWGNAALTLLSLTGIAFVLWHALDWALFSAVFSGKDGRACAGPGVGACWPFITHKLSLIHI